MFLWGSFSKTVQCITVCKIRTFRVCMEHIPLLINISFDKWQKQLRITSILVWQNYDSADTNSWIPDFGP